LLCYSLFRDYITCQARSASTSHLLDNKYVTTSSSLPLEIKHPKVQLKPSPSTPSMEEKHMAGIYLLLMVLSMPLALGIMVCYIMWYEKKLKQESEEKQVVWGMTGRIGSYRRD
jgi:hypothetical protein